VTRDLGWAFGGVYSRDLLPDTLDRKAIVVNTDPHDKPGAHWVCLYMTSSIVEYFDSYGLPPLHRDIQDFIDRHGEGIHNPHVYQDLNTDVCDQYCVYYLHQRLRGKKPSEIGSYPGKAQPYNEIVMWTNGLKRRSVNPEHTKDRFVNVINSICRIVNTILFTALFIVKLFIVNTLLFQNKMLGKKSRIVIFFWI
jgi:hypothetical protein